MRSYRVVSSDSHIVEPADLWTSRADPQWKDRIPWVMRKENGDDMWICDGDEVMSIAVFTQPGVRFEDQEKHVLIDVMESVRPGGYIPEEHVKDMDIDGVDAGVLYPSVSLLFYVVVQDSRLLDTTFRIYNNWLAEFCKPYSNRLKGIAMINVDDVQEGVKELERCANMGLAGAMIPSHLPGGLKYSLPQYERLWAAAQDLDIPLSLHVATNRLRPGEPVEYGDVRDPRAASDSNRDHWVRESLADIIFDGVFERYPKLHVGTVEFELGWIPFFLQRIDYTYTQRPVLPSYHRYKEDMLPSDYFHHNVYISFQEDALGMRLRDIIGVDKMMWGSDYPHLEGTFPKSHEILEEILADCTHEEKAKIAGANCARLFHVN